MATPSTQSKKPKSSKSSLVSHTFPPFYACYLLKSIKTPKSTSTYIGSTPHPPRRIRQHNGEITQGAWKTSHNRPWVMSMIVHGFPSKLAALQFEWAWQNPSVSRHLKEQDIPRTRTFKGNIAVVRSMLAAHPYTSWPLHVKLFTPEAVKHWTAACKNATPLPPGFTFCVELEGVDGKRDDAGSGRVGPIDVTDQAFTSSHLAKHTFLLSTGEPQQCTICCSNLDFHNADTLSLVLCPTSNCTAYSHLSCLANAFLPANGGPDEPSMIPRGGTCKRCNEYVLWGDIVRGCYRRRTGDRGTAIEQSVIVEDAEREGEEAGGALFEDGNDDEDDDGAGGGGNDVERSPTKGPRPRKRKPHSMRGGATPSIPTTPTQRKKTTRQKRRPAPARMVPPDEKAGEFFDFDGVISSGSDSDAPPRASTSRLPLAIVGRKKIKGAAKAVASLSSPPARPRGRPPGSKSTPNSKPKPKPKSNPKPTEEQSRESFDIDDFSSSTGSHVDEEATAKVLVPLSLPPATPPARPRGRPLGSKSKPKSKPNTNTNTNTNTSPVLGLTKRFQAEEMSCESFDIDEFEEEEEGCGMEWEVGGGRIVSAKDKDKTTIEEATATLSPTASGSRARRGKPLRTVAINVDSPTVGSGRSGKTDNCGRGGSGVESVIDISE